jgi:hypothetical protein
MAAEKSPKKKLALLDFAIVFLAILLVFLLCVFVFEVPYWSAFKANPNNSYDTIEAFAYSLAYNRLDGTKSYVSPDKWAFIDTWSTDHEAISLDCKYPDDPDLGSFWISSFDDIKQTLSISFSFKQDCPRYFYVFSISADLKRVDNKWQVMDWSEICERTTEERCY